LATVGAAVIGNQRGVGHDQAHFVGGYVQFFGGGLRVFGASALAALNFSSHDREESVLADVHARGNGFGAPPAAPTAATAGASVGAGLPEKRVAGYRDQQASAQHAEDIPTRWISRGLVRNILSKIERYAIDGNRRLGIGFVQRCKLRRFRRS
jgi:hypothetical protein